MASERQLSRPTQQKKEKLVTLSLSQKAGDFYGILFWYSCKSSGCLVQTINVFSPAFTGNRYNLPSIGFVYPVFTWPPPILTLACQLFIIFNKMFKWGRPSRLTVDLPPTIYLFIYWWIFSMFLVCIHFCHKIFKFFDCLFLCTLIPFFLIVL